MTFKRILEREAEALGRPCKKIGQHMVKVDGIPIRTMVYRPRPVILSTRSSLGEQPRYLVQQEIRVCSYAGNRQLDSSIAKLWTKWYRKKAKPRAAAEDE